MGHTVMTMMALGGFGSKSSAEEFIPPHEKEAIKKTRGALDALLYAQDRRETPESENVKIVKNAIAAGYVIRDEKERDQFFKILQGHPEEWDAEFIRQYFRPEMDKMLKDAGEGESL